MLDINKSILIISALFLAACSSDDSAGIALDLDQACVANSSIAGQWEDSNLKLLVFQNDCTGIEQNCDIEFTYGKPDQGYVKLTVTNHYAGSCATTGEEITCAIGEGSTGTSDYVTLNCSQFGSNVYFR